MNLRQVLSHHKYKFGVFALLLGASMISLVLARVRMLYSNANDYPFLAWNLFLAWIPFVFAAVAYAVSWSRPLLYLVVPACAFVWLIFFPNAPYLLTDFQHLSTDVSNAPVWYDVILFAWFAWTGLLLGVVSLYLMQEVVTRAFSPITGWVFAIGVTILSSIGIYLGRFLRWNSWDILQDPLPIAHDIYEWVRHPFTNIRTYGFTVLFTLLFLFVYLSIYFFARIILERKSQKLNQ